MKFTFIMHSRECQQTASRFISAHILCYGSCPPESHFFISMSIHRGHRKLTHLRNVQTNFREVLELDKDKGIDVECIRYDCQTAEPSVAILIASLFLGIFNSTITFNVSSYWNTC